MFRTASLKFFQLNIINFLEYITNRLKIYSFNNNLTAMAPTTTFMKCLQFAASKHRNQRRKNADQTPYINHPINVATILSDEGHIEDESILMAALLHDTVEDTDATFLEIEVCI